MIACDIDLDLHARAKKRAHYDVTYGVEDDEFVLALAYLDLLERRGLPTPLKCYPFVQITSGKYFDFLYPEKSVFSPEDIAYSLSRIARYNGHTLGSPVYSVAQHCVLAAVYASWNFQFEALMHDSPEFVTGDVTTPLKQLCPDFKLVERRIELDFARRFHLPEHMSPEVKIVDLRMAATEKRDLMPKDLDGEGWSILEGIEPYFTKIVPWPAEYAEKMWLGRFYDLWERHKGMMEIKSS